MGTTTVGALLVARMTNPGGPLHDRQALAAALLSLAALAAIAGAAAAHVAWWSALFNARCLDDPTWFRRLRRAGSAGAVTMPLLGLGALVAGAAGIAYLAGGPDGLAESPRPARPPSTPPPLPAAG